MFVPNIDCCLYGSKSENFELIIFILSFGIAAAIGASFLDAVGTSLCMVSIGKLKIRP